MSIPKPGYIPGVEAATGSLGHGLPMALAWRLPNASKQATAVATPLSDGESMRVHLGGCHACAGQHGISYRHRGLQQMAGNRSQPRGDGP